MEFSMLPLLALLAIGSAAALLSGCSGSTPPANLPSQPTEKKQKNREEDIAYQALERLKTLGPMPDLDRGCPYIRHERNKKTLEYRGAGDGKTQPC